MLARITPHPLTGTVRAIASRSMAHRLLIAAALSDRETRVICDATDADIEAAIGCLNALGAHVEVLPCGWLVHPVTRHPTRDGRPALRDAEFDCAESGSTLGFMLPVVCALGVRTRLHGSERLVTHSLDVLASELMVGGCDIRGLGGLPLMTRGRLRPGSFELPSGTSSECISGLLLALTALDSASTVLVHGPIENRTCVNLTIRALRTFGVNVSVEAIRAVAGGEARTIFKIPAHICESPGTIHVEGDWSTAAFWFCAAALGGTPVRVEGLSLTSAQSNRTILGALSRFGARIERSMRAATIAPDRLQGFTIAARDIPDLVSPLAAVAALAQGDSAVIGCRSLRAEQADRLSATTEVLRALGADIAIAGDALLIRGRAGLSGGVVSAHADPHIAMMAAITAARCAEPVEIEGAQAIAECYPSFFDDYRRLGGHIELIGTRSMDMPGRAHTTTR